MLVGTVRYKGLQFIDVVTSDDFRKASNVNVLAILQGIPISSSDKFGSPIMTVRADK